MNSLQVLSCIFCNEIFDDKETLQIHFRKHGDPKFDHNTRTKNRGQNESPTESVKEENEMVSCDVCPEVFPTISKAITHKHKVHRDHDAKYFCPWCGKLFTLKHLYNKHIQTSHSCATLDENHSFHCDCCDVDFYFPSAMVYHNKFFHRQDTELPDIGHSKKLKFLIQEVVPIYYCPFCGEEYNNKVNLHKHMTDDHSDEHQSPEDILRCPLCEAIFYHLDAYELHLTFHSSEDLYSEENEMIKGITEFSLDTVPPLMEKVENSTNEGLEDFNSLEIDQFLQLTMNKDAEEDNTESTEKVKAKKHKKHKKSKKAITLDEFLNMNTDVFGEGLNFQGIEEVPTRVVTKQLKPKKEASIKNNEKKIMSSTDINKLKKQGITIKMKPSKSTPLNKTKELAGDSSPNRSAPALTNVLRTSSDVLSKLINQSNSQIKIVKKSATGNVDTENTANDEIIDSNETLKLTAISKEFDKTTEEQIDTDNLWEKESELESEVNTHATDIKTDNNSNMTSSISEETSENLTKLNSDDKISMEDKTNEAKLIQEANIVNKKHKMDSDDDDNISDDESPHSSHSNISNLNVLRNISQQVTIKSLSNKLNDIDKASPKSLNDDTLNNCETEIQLNNNKEEESGELNENKKTSVSSANANINNSLNAIKHLSHLITVKSVNQSKPISISQHKEENNIIKTLHEQTPKSNDLCEDKKTGNHNEGGQSTINQSKPENQKTTTTKTLDALKYMNKHLTIKSLATHSSVKPSVETSSGESDNEESINDTDKKVDNALCRNVKKNMVGKKVVNLKIQNSPGTKTNQLQVGNAPTASNKMLVKEIPDDNCDYEIDNECLTKDSSTANLIKRLTNVTAKPISSKQNIKQEQTVQTSSYSINTSKGHVTQNVLKHEKVQEIEIFNIEDSDSDDQEKQEVNNKLTVRKHLINSLNKAVHNTTSDNSNDLLHNISKNIIIKPRNQVSINKSCFNMDNTFEDLGSTSTDEAEDGDLNRKPGKSSVFMGKPHKNLQATLKNLSKHITVKSSNSSPNLYRKSQEINSENNENLDENYFSGDSDSNMGKATITEINENHFSGNESDEDESNFDKDFSVQSPNNLHSDHEDFYGDEENNGQLSDTDSKSSSSNTLKIKCNKFHQKPESQELSPLNNFKKLNKDITIKSLRDKQRIKNIESDFNCSKDASETINNFNKELSIKPFRTNHPKPNNKAEPPTGAPINNTLNENIASTSNQVNTINKEVSVKTFQTQTVIEEITTTVTKTIRTVNQTVKQEVKSTSQTSHNPTIRGPKNVNTNRQGQNAQGIIVRHPSPCVGTKIRNATVSPKPTTSANKMGNQLVPVRPGLKLAKAIPTIPSVRNITQSKSLQQKPLEGRPLKISPQAMNQTLKRSSEETSTQFSCFKKPKECFNSADVPTTGSDSESTINFASSSQSKSDFNSTVKNVKGKTIVSSTQMKSELNTSSQHLTKLGHMSGIKVVKTSTKQATQVEERIENSGDKKTMEALQRLQMQGLLVKRPKFDVSEDNEYPYSGSDNDDDK